MRDVAAYLVIILAAAIIAVSISTVVQGGLDYWEYDRSPQTGVCYERHGVIFGFWLSESMSPVTSTLCDLEE